MRKGVLVLALAVSALAAAEDAMGPVVVDFDKDNVGNAPEGFSFARTGQGPEGSWAIQAAEGAPSGANVLAQTSTDDTDRRFPIAVWTAGSWTDVSVSVKFRPVSGEVDQAGGVVLRYADANNYYVARANAIEGNCRFYYVKGGERRQLGTADVKIETGQWHALKVEAKGSHFTVWVDGKELFQLDDKTFGGAGSVGLWTKADSVTQFDDLMIEAVQ